MSHFKRFLPGMVLAAGLGVFAVPQTSIANPDFTKRTGKTCVGTWTSGKYTDAGQYFKEHHTFKGYVPKVPLKST